MNNNYFVYIIANETWTIYIWVTNNLERRIYEHKNKIFKWFSSKYNCNKLVYFENCWDIIWAIAREKQLKKWSRDKKSKLINDFNQTWKDLSLDWK